MDFLADLGINADELFVEAGLNTRSLLYLGNEIEPNPVIRHLGYTTYTGDDFIAPEKLDTYKVFVPIASLTGVPPEAFRIYSDDWSINVEGETKTAVLLQNPVSNPVRRSLTFAVPSDMPSAFCGQWNAILTFKSQVQNGTDDYGNIRFTETDFDVKTLLFSLGNTETRYDFGADLKTNRIAGYFVDPPFPQVAIAQNAEATITNDQGDLKGLISIDSFPIAKSGKLPFKSFIGIIEFY